MHRRKKLKKEYQLLTILRAFAFIGVTLFHRFTHIFPGGYLAVIIFLVISGFMTMKESTRKKVIDLKSFINKFIKIMGPVYLMMALVMAFSLFAAREIFDDSIGSVIPVALNFENLAKIISNEDYFNQLGNFNIFNHMWYVSLYMQFILIFMCLDKLTHKLGDNIKILIFGLITIISFGLMVGLTKETSDITRVYNGITTRISSFSLGASLYLIDKKFTGKLFKTKNFLKTSIGILSLMIIIPFFLVSGKEIASYKIFFVLYTLASGLLVLSLYSYEDRYPLIYFKRFGILKYIGDRSYFLYIWQYVVQIIAVYFLRDLNIFALIIIEICLLFALAEFNYQLFKNKRVSIILMGISIITLVVLLITSAIIGNAKQKEIEDLRTEITANEELIKKRNEEAKNASKSERPRNIAENNAMDTYDKKAKDTENNDLPAIDQIETKILTDDKADLVFEEKAYDDFDFTENEIAYLHDLSVTAVGDSVIINADKYIRNFIPNFYLDGEVGRDMVDGPAVLRNVANNAGLGDIIIISLGSNGSANDKDMDQIMELVDGRDVYFVNTSHTQSYMDFVNRNIADYCDSHENAHLVDWRGYIKDKPDYLAADRTHPNVPGSDSFAKLIMRKILNVNKVSA